MMMIDGESSVSEQPIDGFGDHRADRRDSDGYARSGGGFVGADHLVALASSGRSIRLFTAPGGLEDFTRD
jgi:hypothetical protein